MAVLSKAAGATRVRCGGLAAAGLGAALTAHSSTRSSCFAPSARVAGTTPSTTVGDVSGSLAPAHEARVAGALAGGSLAAAALSTALVAQLSRPAKTGRRAGQRKRSKDRRSTKTVASTTSPGQQGLHDLMKLAGDLIANPQSISLETLHAVRDFASAEGRKLGQHHPSSLLEFQRVAAGAATAVQRSVGEQLRWAGNSMAAMLLTYAVTLVPASAMDQVSYSGFLEQVQSGNVEVLRVEKNLLRAQYKSKDGSQHEVNLVPNAAIEDQLFNSLAEKKVDVVMQGTDDNNFGPLDFVARFAGSIAWLIVGLLLAFGGAGGAAGQNPFAMGKSPAKIIKDGETKVKFDDVAGCDGAKEELVEVVDFLSNTSRYSDLGAKIPKGALLVGPPGTGKTLLAKAVAGEAGVPFFSVAASEFVEMVAGVGAARVRDLFAEAKKAAPCIIFIDEIDAVGRQRSAGFGQGNDEREQTVNQLLTEMDGFEANNGVVVMAATNRADILDSALKRPGRFDRQIQVDPPDVEGRNAILKVHARDKSLAPSVDLSAIARQTPGMSGADLANLLNEGAIVAARQNKLEIDQDDIASALERIAIGLEKKDAVMSEKKRQLVAYHEAGHAIVAALMNDFDIVAKISIVPRGPAGGVTIFMPSEDRLNSGLYSKEFLENRMCVALGGRLAEEIINGKDNVTTGASNDFQQCTQVAQAMVTQLGMSDVVGQRVVGQQGGGGPFMGRDMMGGGAPPVSQLLKRKIDAEVKRIIQEQYERGMQLLTSNRHLLDALAQKLLEQEKVSGDELVKLINETTTQRQGQRQPELLATAAYAGQETVSKTAGPEQANSPQLDHEDDLHAAAALVSRRRSRHSAQTELANRLHLELPQPAHSQPRLGDVLLKKVEKLAQAASSEPVPAAVTRAVAAQLLAVVASGGALPAHADQVTELQGEQQQQTQRQKQEMREGRVTYSHLLEYVEQGSVESVDLYDEGRIAVSRVDMGDRQEELVCDLPGATTGFIERLQANGVSLDVHTPGKPDKWVQAFADSLLPLLIIGSLLYLRSQGRSGGGLLPGFGSKAEVMVSPQTGVKFEDVAGVDEAKEELAEIVDFLEAPERFVKVGAQIPRGVLLSGPPGTGKTLMAKALAGEAGVPFIQTSAAEFIELFVGVGASRVRDIFRQAKEKSPCIIFIDEIDAIGRQRSGGSGRGSDEREQTLNQILTEMDGFEGNAGVIVVAATNRPDSLDNALLRPGRFDRRVTVGLPDVRGREQILNVHIKNKKLEEHGMLRDVAKRTAGFSGADLENLMNEAAILAARRGKQSITLSEIDDATDRVIAGLRGRALADNASKKLIAYHEAGHALVGTLLPHHDPVSKVTLIPRGQAKGLTWFSPAEDQSLVSANTMRARIAGALGGRAAEQLVFGSSQVTSGAGGDLQMVERLARAMVTQFGMSEMGTLAIDDGGFVGPSYSDELGSKIDDAIKGISDECFASALGLLHQHRACLDRLADELVELESLSGERLREIVAEYTQIPDKLAAV